jgi:coiled-coil domain-containing protein 130
VVKPRLEELQSLSEHYNGDPYSLSVKVRKKFREQKKVEMEKRRLDDEVKTKYALPTELRLIEEGEEELREARTEWKKNQELRTRKRRRLGGSGLGISSSSTPSKGKVGASKSNVVSALRAQILDNTARQSIHRVRV